jgi:hypothetical protein
MSRRRGEKVTGSGRGNVAVSSSKEDGYPLLVAPPARKGPRIALGCYRGYE